MAVQNLWAAGGDALLASMAAREEKRIRDEALARALEDRQREIQRQADADARTRTVFDQGQEDRAHELTRRPVEEQFSDVAKQLGVTQALSGMGRATDTHEWAAENQQYLEGRRPVEDALDDEARRAQIAAGRRQGSTEARRQALLTSYAQTAPGSPERQSIVDAISILEGRAPQAAPLPAGVRTMIGQLAAQPGMTRENMTRALQVALPSLLEAYPGLAPEQLFEEVTGIFGRAQPVSALDTAMGGGAAGVLPDDQLRDLLPSTMGGRPPVAPQFTAQALAEWQQARGNQPPDPRLIAARARELEAAGGPTPAPAPAPAPPSARSIRDTQFAVN